MPARPGHLPQAAGTSGAALSAAASSSGPLPFPELSPREREILELMARGDGNVAIARRLSLSEKTVRNHVSDIFMKLRVPDRVQAVVMARDAGLGAGR